MKVDLTQALNASLPWDLTITIRGADRRTVRPTVADLSLMRSAGRMTDDEVRGLVAGLFDPPPEPHQLPRLTDEEVGGVLAVYAAYYRERTLKNVGKVADLVRDQMRQTPAVTGT